MFRGVGYAEKSKGTGTVHVTINLIIRTELCVERKEKKKSLPQSQWLKQ